ncbi:hypothetical protein AB0C93_37925 [Streptomyces sp. NPDC048518]|uniref:hypothetical protein n=1 Tax=Streptomyces sp. NPDC048518 TaxID=3155029 RepID=UPI0033E270E4
MKGREALILEINRIVATVGIKSPLGSKRGLDARLNYLKKSAQGRQALRDQGVTDRAMKSWLKGKATPSAANRERIDSAYWTRKRENMVRSGALKRHLENGHASRRMEIYPVDQSQVPTPRYRPNISQRTTTPHWSVWGPLVDAWADQNEDEIDEIWEDIISDLDSDLTAYAYVSSVGIAA